MSAAAAATSEYAEGVACASTSRARRRHRRCDTTRVVSMRGRRSQDSNGRRYRVRQPLFERSQPTTVSSAVSAYERVSVTVHRSSRMRTMSPRRGAGTGTASPRVQSPFRYETGLFMRIRSSRIAENATTPKDVTGRKCVPPKVKTALTVGLYQSRDGGSEVGFRGIPEFNDQRMPFQHLVHDAALHALAASVDQSHLAEAGFVRGVDVLLDDRRNIAGRE